jgi:hypothetical protein
VKIYGVQAGGSASATSFNEEMAKLTGGNRLSLKNFGCIFDVLMMICYREGNPAMLAVRRYCLSFETFRPFPSVFG